MDFFTIIKPFLFYKKRFFLTTRLCQKYEYEQNPGCSPVFNERQKDHEVYVPLGVYINTIIWFLKNKRKFLIV